MTKSQLRARRRAMSPADAPEARPALRSAIAEQADFSTIRYAQCWEDAEILLEALDIQPGDTCLSIASAGDNTLALLTRAPGRVIALDLSQSQPALAGDPALLGCASGRHLRGDWD